MTMQADAGPGARAGTVEWGTLSLIAGCYGLWGAALVWLVPVSGVVAFVVLAVLIAFHASLTHEVIHGHPFRSRRLNDALMFLPLNLAFPYERFRDQHLAHHRDEFLTDPYDDPETNYLDPAVWTGLPLWLRLVYRINNTLAGRMILGPALGQVCFLRDEWRLLRAGATGVLRAWVLHLAGAVAVLWIVQAAGVSMWLYLGAAYAALSLLKIRTFLEHRAHQRARARTVIIEDRGPLAFLFLNNNLHVVHHMHPRVPWHRLPALYAANREKYLSRNDGYRYRSYGEVFARYFLRAKDPVAHPLWPWK